MYVLTVPWGLIPKNSELHRAGRMLPHLGDWRKTMGNCLPTTSSGILCKDGFAKLLHLPVLRSGHNHHCLQPPLLWLLHVHRAGQVQYSSHSFECAWWLVLQLHKSLPTMFLTGQPRLEWFGGGGSTRSNQCLECEVKRPPEREGQDQWCTGSRGHIGHSSSLQHKFVQ